MSAHFHSYLCGRKAAEWLIYMKQKTNILPGFTLLAGAAGCAMWLWLLGSGTDSKGLLAEGHPAWTLCLILTALVLAVLALCVRPLVPMSNYARLFPAWPLAGLGCIAAALGILYANLRELTQRQDLLTVLTALCGIGACVCLVLLGLRRWKGQRPHYLLHTAVTVYCMLHLVSQYRLWSSEPQLQVYMFPLLASVFLMLTAYHSCVLDAGKGSRRWFVFCNQAALFFSFLALPGESWPFYLAMVLWTATGLCSLKPRRTHASDAKEY